MNPTPQVSPSSSPSAGAASGSSFYAAMRILPVPQRAAMYEIYSFCRRVDDVADGGETRDVRRAQLDSWRAAIEACYGTNAPADLSNLVTQIKLFDLQKEDFMAVIDGMQMDVDEDVVAPDWATLDLYCDRVASAVDGFR